MRFSPEAVIAKHETGNTNTQNLRTRRAASEWVKDVRMHNTYGFDARTLMVAHRMSKEVCAVVIDEATPIGMSESPERADRQLHQQSASTMPTKMSMPITGTSIPVGLGLGYVWGKQMAALRGLERV